MSDPMLYGLGVVAVAIVTLVTCLFRPGRQLARSAIMVGCNFVVGVIFVHNTMDYTPWAFNILIDSVAAFVIMRHPACFAQGLLGALYALQVCMHVAFGGREAFGMLNDNQLYYDGLTWVAWLQLAALGGWCGWIWAKPSMAFRRDRGHSAVGRKGTRHLGSRG